MTARASGLLRVRPMRLDEVAVRIDYFHDSSDEHLRRLGVDRSRLPSRAEWHRFYEVDLARPLPERENHSLVWLLDEEIVGFSTADRIVFGQHAFMHLHLLRPDQRHAGLGARFVRLSVPQYVADLELERLYCQPNAFNTAPNRTLQKAGFRYLETLRTRPSAINHHQAVTRWVWEAAP